MRLLLFRLLAAAFLLSHAAAYSTPGAWERMWFYYAYLLDCKQNNGVAAKIATGCAKVMGTGGKQCSFNQFIQYIVGGEKLDASNFAVTTDLEPDLDDTVKTLGEKKLTGAYNAARIYGSVGPDDIAGLFKQVGYVVGGKVAGAEDSIKNALKTSTVAVARSRQSATFESIKSDLTAKGLTVKTKQIAVYDGAAETIDWLDRQGTLAASSGVADAEKTLKTIVKTYNNDAGHSQNIKEARAAASLVMGACGE